MTLSDRISGLVRELAGQQAAPDPWWQAELASILEAIADREFERRLTQDRRQSVVTRSER
jgi:hypothetical protein